MPSGDGAPPAPLLHGRGDGMSKQAKVTFKVLRLNRWSVAFFVLLALALVFFPFERLSALLPVLSNASKRVENGVTFLGRDLSGKSARELEQLLAQVAQQIKAPPVDAAVKGRELLPDLNGVELDVNATYLRVITAQPGQLVEPKINEIKAAKTIDDFPNVPIYKGNPAKPQVTFLVNVAWGEQDLPAILDIFKENGVKATFFLTKPFAQKNKALVQRLAQEGHELANHGYANKSPLELSKEELTAEIVQTERVVKEFTGKKTSYYSPHKGEYNDQVLATATGLGYRTIMWSLDTVDWDRKPAAEIVRRIVPHVKGGDLILMHPLSNTKQALPQILAGLKEKGLSPVTLTEMLSPTPVLGPASIKPSLQSETTRS